MKPSAILSALITAIESIDLIPVGGTESDPAVHFSGDLATAMDRAEGTDDELACDRRFELVPGATQLATDNIVSRLYLLDLSLTFAYAAADAPQEAYLRMADDQHLVTKQLEGLVNSTGLADITLEPGGAAVVEQQFPGHIFFTRRLTVRFYD